MDPPFASNELPEVQRYPPSFPQWWGLWLYEYQVQSKPKVSVHSWVTYSNVYL